MDIKTLKIQYLEHLEIEKNRSPKTLENYGRYLDRFFQFALRQSSGQAKILNPGNITEELIRQYRLYLNRLKDTRGGPLKKVTQNYHIIALRNFLKYLAKRDIKSVPAEKVELGKQEDREVTFLESDELERLLKSPEGGSLDALRDRAVLGTLFSTGMRVSELCSLDRDKIDITRGELSIRGKGSKIRVVFLSDDAKEDINKYLGKRSDIDEALFIRIPRSKASGSFAKDSDLRLTPRSIQRIVEKYATKAGIVGKNVSPHTLRHSYATDLLRNGADIRSVQALLGHASVTTTQIYTHVTDKQLREVHKRFHNKNKKTDDFVGYFIFVANFNKEQRVNIPAINPYPQMQMRAGNPLTGITGTGDSLTVFDYFVLFHQNLRQVHVDRENTSAMINDNHQSFLQSLAIKTIFPLLMAFTFVWGAALKSTPS